MNEFIYSICIKGSTYPGLIFAMSKKDAENKVIYMYQEHISHDINNMAFNDFKHLLYQECNISLSDIFNINEL